MASIANTETPAVGAKSWLRLQPAAARFSFRGNAAAQLVAGAAFGLPFPTNACRSATNSTRAALWLGPDEQLLLAAPSEAESLRAALETALASMPHSIVDVSHRQVALELRGPHAAWILNAGCPLDLDATAFPIGMCTRTVFAKTDIVLWRTATEHFHVEVWRSFTDYLVGMLREVAREVAG